MLSLSATLTKELATPLVGRFLKITTIPLTRNVFLATFHEKSATKLNDIELHSVR